MKHTKHLLALLLIAVMALSLFGCSKSKELRKYYPDYFFDSDDYIAGKVDLKELDVETTIDAQAIFDNLTYTARMLYGDYRLYNKDDIKGSYQDNATYVPFPETEYGDPETLTRTAVPYQFYADRGSMHDKVACLPGYEWMEMYFRTDTNSTGTMKGAYFVDGHTLKFFPLAEYSEDEETGEIYFRIADYSYDYEFSFHGRCLTLSQGDMSVDLYPEDFCKDANSVLCTGYLQPDSPALDGLSYLSFDTFDMNSKNCHSYCFLGWNEDDDDYESKYSANHLCSSTLHLTEDGVCTIAIRKGKDAPVTVRQFAYFFCGSSGIILTDGETVYDYSECEWKHFSGSLTNAVDADALDAMSEDQAEEIAQKRESLLDDLTKAMQDAGIGVEIDREAGEVRLDASVLFATNDYSVSVAGKVLLQKFIDAYTSVLVEDKYTDFISEVAIEGHTDNAGDYESNLTLSQNRAQSVLDYCLSEECGLSAAQRDLLSSIASPVGYSYDRLIFNSDGTVNMAASRRVTFRFRISLLDAE